MRALPPPPKLPALPFIETQAVIVTDASVNVTDLVRQAIDAHRAVGRAESRATPYAWKCGHLLIQIRDARKRHKEWEKSFWPGGDLVSVFSISTAKRYIRLAQAYPSLDDLMTSSGYMPLWFPGRG